MLWPMSDNNDGLRFLFGVVAHTTNAASDGGRLASADLRLFCRIGSVGDVPAVATTIRLISLSFACVAYLQRITVSTRRIRGEHLG